MKIRILGCGTSSGVPRIGNDWGTCDPAEPRNWRTRASILVTGGRTRILVDTSPDMRWQLLDADIDDVDAVIWTHDHADHCHGLDDLRQLFHVKGHPVDCYARRETLDGLKQRFAYAFQGHDGYPPTVTGHLLSDRLSIGEMAISVVDQPHGNITSAGIRFDSEGRAAAYSTDLNGMTSEMEALFQGLDLWIVDALRERPHPTHPHLELTLEWIARLRPKRAIIVHMDHTMDYATLRRKLPDGVEPGYDGLEIDLA